VIHPIQRLSNRTPSTIVTAPFRPSRTAACLPIWEKESRYNHLHIEIVDAEVCQLKCKLKPCTFCCPASCYTKEGDGQVTLITDGCLECGTCRVICSELGNVRWEYPRGGYGIQFKFG